MSRVFKWLVLSFVALLALAFVIGMTTDPPSPAATTAAAAPAPEPRAGLTMANYTRLQSGMTYQQVVDILGSPGVEMSRSDLAGFTTVMYQWEGRFGANMNVMFQNGKMVQKAQAGLR